MKVSYLLRRSGNRYHAIAPERSLSEAVSLMMRHRIGSLLAIKGDTLTGIITERDVLGAVDRHCTDPAAMQLLELRVADLMSTELVTCSSEDSVDHAMELMISNPTGRRVRHLPVLDNGRLVGMVAISDVIEALLTETEFENKLLRNYIKNWPEPD